MHALSRQSLVTSLLLLTEVLRFSLTLVTASVSGYVGIEGCGVDMEKGISMVRSCSYCESECSPESDCVEKSVQSSYAGENDNRVWMLTTEGIQSDLIQYNRIIPGHKYIINNVGGRRLRFGPEDPPRQYVSMLGEYDCMGPLAPLSTLFPRAAKESKWWTHQTRPHEKWIFNAPSLGEMPDGATGFCITVTDLETGKTAKVKLRVGTLTQF